MDGGSRHCTYKRTKLQITFLASLEKLALLVPAPIRWWCTWLDLTWGLSSPGVLLLSICELPGPWKHGSLRLSLDLWLLTGTVHVPVNWHWQHLGTFLVVTTGVCSRPLVGQARDAVKHPETHRMAPTTEDDLALTVTGVEVRKHWCRKLDLIWGTLKNINEGTIPCNSDFHDEVVLPGQQESSELSRWP